MSSKTRKYTEATVKKLFALSGNCCAFPNCSHRLVNENNILIAEICHIEGLNEDSARHNPNLETPNDDINLILLCPTHHTLIDKDEISYPTLMIKSWKEEHENRFINEQYNPPQDVIQQTINQQIIINNHFNIYPNLDTESEDLGVISEIYEYIQQHKPTKVTNFEVIEPSKLLDLVPKIQLNFPQEQRETVNRLIRKVWGKKEVVDDFIRKRGKEDEASILELAYTIQDAYCKLKASDSAETRISDIQIIKKLALDYLPLKKQNNPSYIANSEALIFYFFEFCYFGEKTLKEKNINSQQSLF